MCVITTRPDLRRKLRDKGEDRCTKKERFSEGFQADSCSERDQECVCMIPADIMGILNHKVLEFFTKQA